MGILKSNLGISSMRETSDTKVGGTSPEFILGFKEVKGCFLKVSSFFKIK